MISDTVQSLSQGISLAPRTENVLSATDVSVPAAVWHPCQWPDPYCCQNGFSARRCSRIPWNLYPHKTALSICSVQWRSNDSATTQQTIFWAFISAESSLASWLWMGKLQYLHPLPLGFLLSLGDSKVLPNLMTLCGPCHCVFIQSILEGRGSGFDCKEMFMVVEQKPYSVPPQSLSSCMMSLCTFELLTCTNRFNPAILWRNLLSATIAPPGPFNQTDSAVNWVFCHMASASPRQWSSSPPGLPQLPATTCPSWAPPALVN